MQQELGERKRAEEAFRDSEEKYRLLFERSPLPMWVYDRRTLRFLTANDAAVRYYGYSREELLNMSAGEISYSEDASALLLKLAKGIPGLTNTGAWRHRKKDGTTIDVEVVSHEILFGGKRAMLELMNDVTERKRAEEALQKREEHFRSLIENASDLILIANSHGTLSYISPSVDRALYYSPEELLGRNLFEFVHPGHIYL
jgi:PAS domain S-box-containing protein